MPPRGYYPNDSIVSFPQLRAKMHSVRSDAETYTVAQGDSPSAIETKTGMDFDDIVTLNPGLDDEGLFPGQSLILMPARPFITVRNIHTAVYEEEVPYPTEEIPTDTYVQGYRMPSVRGVPGLEQVTAAVSRVNGREVGREIMDRVLLRPPVTEKIIVGTHNPRDIMPDASYAVSESGFLWPTSGGSINNGLGGYPGHTGVDIPRPAGTPIFAAMSGTVVQARNTGSNYGRYVILEHGNGYTTLYAHCSALHVNVGQVVRQGDIIASVGSTGRSTGNHLHFEVRYLGQVMNPRLYIG